MIASLLLIPSLHLAAAAAAPPVAQDPVAQVYGLEPRIELLRGTQVRDHGSLEVKPVGVPAKERRFTLQLAAGEPAGRAILVLWEAAPTSAGVDWATRAPDLVIPVDFEPVELGSGTSRLSVDLSSWIQHRVGATAIVQLVAPRPSAPTGLAFSSQWKITVGGSVPSVFRDRAYLGGSRAQEVASADLNNDGVVDLVVPGSGEGPPTTLLGTGEGDFEAASQNDYELTSGQLRLAVADFDGDGFADAATLDELSGGVEFFRGSGTGELESVVEYDLPSGDDLVAGDWNGDSVPDLAVIRSGEVLLYRNLGEFAFGELVVLQEPGNRGRLIAEDFNGDGILDLAIATDGSASEASGVRLRLGTGDGLFSPGVLWESPWSCADLVSGDFDLDGVPDIACSLDQEGDQQIAVFLGVGGGQLAAPTFLQFPDWCCLGTPVFGNLQVGDWGGDGRPDLLASWAGGGTILYEGLGNGAFKGSRNLPIESDVSHLVDFNGDGFDDLIAVSWEFVPTSETTFSVDVIKTIASNGAPVDSDGLVRWVPGGLTGQQASASVVLDANGDGLHDLAAVEPTGLRWKLGIDEDWSDVPGEALFDASAPWGVISGDLDGDGDADLAFADEATDRLQVLLQGDDGFEVGATLDSGQGPRWLVSDDLDGDGTADLACANSFSNSVSVFLNSGAGQFTALGEFGVGNAPWQVVAGDIDQDGATDLVACNALSSSVSVLTAAPGGGFAPAQSFSTGNSPRSVCLADFNGDGLPDVATANAQGKNVSVLINDGAGGFFDFQVVPLSPDLSGEARPWFIRSGDIDGDGSQDLVVAIARDTLVCPLLGNGDGSFQTLSPLQVDSDPRCVEIVDVNDDGVLDITVSGTTNWYQEWTGDGLANFTKSLSAPIGSFPRGHSSVQLKGVPGPGVALANSASGTLELFDPQELAFSEGPEFKELGGRPHRIAALDMDLDGREEVVAGFAQTSELGIYRWVQGDLFESDSTIPLPSPATDLEVADVDLNGVPDLVSLCAGAESIVFLLADGRGDFNVQRLAIDGFAGSALAVGQLGGGSLGDVVVASRESRELLAVINVHKPIPLRTQVALEFEPFAIATQDVDGSGLADVVVVGEANDEGFYQVFRNRTTGFQALPPEPTGLRPRDVAVVDLDFDGHLDLLVSNDRPYSCTVHRGAGDGTFGAPKFYGDFASLSAATADLDGNGTADAAVSAGAAGALLRFSSQTLVR